MNNLENAKQFFENFTGEKAIFFEKLPQSGSERINFIAGLSDEKYVVTFNNNLRENEAFFYFSEIFSELKLNTPKVFDISTDRKTYVQEYLGAQTLSQIIEKEGASQRVKKMVQQTLDRLFDLQTKTLGKIDYRKTFEYEIYDELPVLNDLFYFKKLFIDILEVQYHKSSLLKEFKKIVTKIENLEPRALMIRDFQARNIMANHLDQIFFIDYQGAMEGPVLYDVISFLHQAKANFPENFKNEMTGYYISKFDLEKQVQLNLSVKPLQLIRFMQVLGAYGFRGLIQRKSHFISSIEKGIENLCNFSENWKEMNDYPELKKVIAELKSPVISAKIGEILR